MSKYIFRHKFYWTSCHKKNLFAKLRNDNYQIEGVYVLSHVGDVRRLLGERHVEFTRDAVGQLDVTRGWEDTSH